MIQNRTTAIREYAEKNPFFCQLANRLARERAEPPPFPDVPALPTDSVLAQVLLRASQDVDSELRYVHAELDRTYAELEWLREENARLRWLALSRS